MIALFRTKFLLCVEAVGKSGLSKPTSHGDFVCSPPLLPLGFPGDFFVLFSQQNPQPQKCVKCLVLLWQSAAEFASHAGSGEEGEELELWVTCLRVRSAVQPL